MAQTRVVTISHATGAGGDNIGRSVAKGLGFRYVDEEIIQLAAERQGLDAEIVADAERRKGLLDRILGDMAAPPMMLEPTAGMTMLPREAFVTREDVRGLIVDAIKETADRGNVVIVSHAAGIPLAGRRDVLRVLITASFEPRARRVAEATRSSKADAEKSLKSSDAGRADYFVRFYGIEQELPTHYDVVINTDTLTPEEATDLVIAAARRH